MLIENFGFPPFLVFPSWEKSLEERDEVTISSIKQFVVDVFSHYIEPTISNIEDIFTYANSNEDEFLRRIEQ